MLSWLLVLGLLGLSALSIVLRRVYTDSPELEVGQTGIKSRSIRSTKREHVLSALLLLISIISFTGFTLSLVGRTHAFFVFLLTVLGFLYVFFIIPGYKTKGLSRNIASSLSPMFIYLLSNTKKYTKNLEKYLASYQKKHTHYQSLTRAEILGMLEQQKDLSEGRTLGFELASAIKSIKTTSKKSVDFMQKIEELHLVGINESVGPILIDELHKSGRKNFLVNSPKHGIVGTVLLKDLIGLKDGGKVEGVYEPANEFLESDQDVREILELFVDTSKNLFVVTDEDGEKIGALYFEDVIKALTTD